MATISDALELRPSGDGRWLAHADPDHQSITGMFGGWTAALLLGAVTRTSRTSGAPSALTVHYVAAVDPGDDVVVTAQHLGGSRSIDHWRADLRPSGRDAVLACALVVLTSRRATQPHLELAAPDVPGPEESQRVHAPGPQGLQTDMRYVSGAFSSGDTRSALWVRDASGRPLDHVLLTYLADQIAPRSYFWLETPGLSATLCMSVHFHATPEEMAAVGDDYVLSQASGTRGEQSTSGHQGRLWSRGGALLATTEQLCWYR